MIYWGSMLADVDHVRRLSKDGKADTISENSQSAIHHPQSLRTSTAPEGHSPQSDVTTAKRREQAAPSGGRSESSHRDAERGGLAVDAAGATLGTSSAASAAPSQAIQATPIRTTGGCCQPLGRILAGIIARSVAISSRIVALNDVGPIRRGQVLTWRDDAAGGAWWTPDGQHCLPAICAAQHYGRSYGPAPAQQRELFAA